MILARKYRGRLSEIVCEMIGRPAPSIRGMRRVTRPISPQTRRELQNRPGSLPSTAKLCSFDSTANFIFQVTKTRRQMVVYLDGTERRLKTGLVAQMPLLNWPGFFASALILPLNTPCTPHDTTSLQAIGYGAKSRWCDHHS